MMFARPSDTISNLKGGEANVAFLVVEEECVGLLLFIVLRGVKPVVVALIVVVVTAATTAAGSMIGAVCER